MATGHRELATANTGLAEPDVFYFGNAIGESGNSSTDAAVTAADALAARGRISATTSVSIDSNWDYNRDGFITVADMQTAQHNYTAGDAVLNLIAPPAAPEPMAIPLSVATEPEADATDSITPTIPPTSDTDSSDIDSKDAISSTIGMPTASTLPPPTPPSQQIAAQREDEPAVSNALAAKNTLPVAITSNVSSYSVQPILATATPSIAVTAKQRLQTVIDTAPVVAAPLSVAAQVSAPTLLASLAGTMQVPTPATIVAPTSAVRLAGQSDLPIADSAAKSATAGVLRASVVPVGQIVPTTIAGAATATEAKGSQELSAVGIGISEARPGVASSPSRFAPLSLQQPASRQAQAAFARITAVNPLSASAVDIALADQDSEPLSEVPGTLEEFAIGLLNSVARGNKLVPKGGLLVK